MKPMVILPLTYVEVFFLGLLIEQTTPLPKTLPGGLELGDRPPTNRDPFLPSQAGRMQEDSKDSVKPLKEPWKCFWISMALYVFFLWEVGKNHGMFFFSKIVFVFLVIVR